MVSCVKSSDVFLSSNNNSTIFLLQCVESLMTKLPPLSELCHGIFILRTLFNTAMCFLGKAVVDAEEKKKEKEEKRNK